MKKVCIICPSLYPHIAGKKLETDGGAEAQFKALGLAFLKNGFDIHFIVDDYGQPEKEVVNGSVVHKIPFRYRGGSNFYIIETWFKLLKKLFDIQADVHFIKFPRELLVPLGFFCKIQRKRSVFIGQIDNDVNPNFLKRENLFSYYIFRIGLKLTNLIVAQNKKQKEGFMRYYRKDSIIIPNILSMPVSKNRKNKSYILWVGNTLPKKRPELLLKLAQNLPNYRFKLIMAPTAKVPDDSFIRKKAECINNLDYIGYVPFSEISEYYEGASLLVSTSEMEGFPNTFLQAWQHQTPVVSLDVNPDGIIATYKIGCHSKTFNNLIRDVKKMMENATLRSDIGENGKNYVNTFHSERAILPMYIGIINS